MSLTAKEIADRVGRSRIAEKCGGGVTLQAVTNAIGRGKFPRDWLFPLTDLCAEVGISLPPEMCNMKVSDPKASLAEAP